MKRWAPLLAFLVAGVAAAQEGTYADSKNNFAVSKDGGSVTISGGGIADPGANGILIRTALNTTINRLLATGNAGIGITNADGTAGNPTVTLNTFVASGASHAVGGVPDPGATAGTFKYLREDATWVDPIMDPTIAVFANENYCGVATYSSAAIGAGTQGNSTSSDVTHPCTRLLSTTTAAATGFHQEWVNTSGAPSNINSYGQGQIDFMEISQLSSKGDGTDKIIVIKGLCNQVNDATECTNGIYFLYDFTVNTTNWLICVAKNGVGTTRTDTGIAVTTGSMVRSSWTLNAAGTSITCTIGGVACSTPVTTNIPTGGSGVVIKLDKTAGVTTAFTLNMNRVVAVQHGLPR